MKTALYTFSAFVLIAAGVVFERCGTLWLQNIQEIEQNPGLSIKERFQKAVSSRENNSQQAVSPFVQQAQDFAVYINPPRPPEPKQTMTVRTSSERKNSSLNLPNITPKFRLLATCYNRSRPEESVALVSEPGRDSRWVEKGELLGHFVVESVEQGMIVYRHGDRLHEMKVETKDSIQIAQLQQQIPEIGQTGTSSPNASVTCRTCRTMKSDFGLFARILNNNFLFII